MKTPEELAEEYAMFGKSDVPDSVFKRQKIAEQKFDFLAGYKAAQEQQEKEWGALVSKGRIAMQTLNDQLADADKVIIPRENCEAALKVMQSAQELSERAIKWMKTLPTASERCNQCACEGYRAGYQAAAPQWVSVKDRLPENGQEVLWLMPKGAMAIGCLEDFEGSSKVAFGLDGLGLELFTYWMPLPEAPKGGG